MKSYLPIKWRNGESIEDCDTFKTLQKLLGHREYLEGDCETFKATDIVVEKPEEYKTTPSVESLFNDIFDKYIEDEFKGHRDTVKVIVRCFEAVQHRDADWSRSLFLSLVVNADPAGHILTAAKSEINGRLNIVNTRMILRAGDIFILDPWAIHSVQNRSKEKKELVLAQWEINFSSREMALKFLENTNYEFVNLS